MCAGALSLLGFGQVIFGAGNEKFGGCGSIISVNDSTCGCCSGRCACVRARGTGRGECTPARIMQARESGVCVLWLTLCSLVFVGRSDTPACVFMLLHMLLSEPLTRARLCRSLGLRCCSAPAQPPHGKAFTARGGLFAEEAVQLLQMFYFAGNPLGACCWWHRVLFVFALGFSRVWG